MFPNWRHYRKEVVAELKGLTKEERKVRHAEIVNGDQYQEMNELRQLSRLFERLPEYKDTEAEQLYEGIRAENEEFRGKEKHRNRKELEDIYYDNIQTSLDEGLPVEFEGDEQYVIKFLQWLFQAVNPGLLHSLLISKIVFDQRVNIAIGRDNYLVPYTEYAVLLKQYPKLAQYRFRGESFVSWNKMPFNYVPKRTPIRVYSHEGLGNDVSYLQSIPEDKRQDTFERGTLMHELAHQFWWLYVDQYKREKLTDVLSNTEKPIQPITDYAATYRDDKLLYAEETFCELVRLYSTAPAILMEWAAQSEGLQQMVLTICNFIEDGEGGEVLGFRYGEDIAD
jgi:hypothetical protein